MLSLGIDDGAYCCPRMSDKERPALQRSPPDDEDLIDHLEGGVHSERKTPPVKPKNDPPASAQDQPHGKKP
jgi:hypothetical protein